LSAQDRWTIPAELTLCREPSRDFHLNTDELNEIAKHSEGERTVIDRTIRDRDFRLIDQCDCVVVYRPQFQKGEWSGGTKAEVAYARHKGRVALLVHDPDLDSELTPDAFDLEFREGPDLFNQIGNLADPSNQEKVLDQVIQRLNTLAPELIKPRTS